jgi:hypothetical protein
VMSVGLAIWQLQNRVIPGQEDERTATRSKLSKGTCVILKGSFERLLEKNYLVA